MPSMLPPDAARYSLHDGVPTLTLAVDPPAELVEGQWSLLNRLTVVLVDGPWDEGFLVARMLPDGDTAPEWWDEAVARAGGSRVRFGTGAEAPALFARNLA